MPFASSRACLFALGLVLGGCGASEAASSEDAVIAKPATEPSPPRAGAGTTAGALNGESISVADAVVFVGAVSEREPDKRGARIVLDSNAGTCAQPGVLRASGAVLTLDVPVADGVPAVGEYSVPRALGAGPNSVVARLDVANASCSRRTIIASDGRLTIEDTSDGRVRGSFRFTLGRDSITGSFDAAPCSGGEPPLALRCSGPN